MTKRNVKKAESNNVCEGADLSGYVKVKAASGNMSLDCGDDIAKKLRGLDLDAVYKLAAQALGESQRTLRSKYRHLNAGMQRMNLSNRMRGAQR
jgi:hypothetical protein